MQIQIQQDYVSFSAVKLTVPSFRGRDAPQAVTGPQNSLQDLAKNFIGIDQENLSATVLLSQQGHLFLAFTGRQAFRIRQNDVINESGGTSMIAILNASSKTDPAQNPYRWP